MQPVQIILVPFKLFVLVCEKFEFRFTTIFLLFSLDPSNDIFSPLFPEDRIIFGLHPASFFETTLSHFKKLYNKNDAKLIAKQVFM